MEVSGRGMDGGWSDLRLGWGQDFTHLKMVVEEGMHRASTLAGMVS